MIGTERVFCRGRGSGVPQQSDALTPTQISTQRGSISPDDDRPSRRGLLRREFVAPSPHVIPVRALGASGYTPQNFPAPEIA